MQSESNGDCNPCVDIEAEQSHAVIDHEELHQKRRTLEDGDVTRGCPTHRWGFGGAGQGHEEPEDTTARKAYQCQRDRPLQALHEEEQFVGTYGWHSRLLT